MQPLTFNHKVEENRNFLRDLPPGRLLEEQLAIFHNQQLLETVLAYKINLLTAQKALQSMEGCRIIALSAGGSNLVRGDFIIHNRSLHLAGQVQVLQQSIEGEGYLAHIEQVACEAKEQNTPIGLAYAAKIASEKREILENARLTLLRQEINAKYGGDFANAIPTLRAFGTDSVMGMIAGMMIAKTKRCEITEGINFINGTGIGIAVYLERDAVGEIYVVSAEYRPVIDQLLPIRSYRKNQGAKHENITNTISGTAITNLYHYATGKRLDGPVICLLAQQGDELATRLYVHSALIGAHVIVGVGRDLYGLFRQPDSTAIILEGSLCEGDKVPGYANLLIKTVNENVDCTPIVVYPQDLPVIPSLMGAAVAVLDL